MKIAIIESSYITTITPPQALYMPAGLTLEKKDGGNSYPDYTNPISALHSKKEQNNLLRWGRGIEFKFE